MNYSTIFFVFSAVSIVSGIIWLFQVLKNKNANPNESGSIASIEKLNPAKNLFGIITAAAFVLTLIFYFTSQQQLEKTFTLDSENIEKTDSIASEETTEDTAAAVEEAVEVPEIKIQDIPAVQTKSKSTLTKKKTQIREEKKRDTDSDGINDENDLCPKAAGPSKNKGCPEIKDGDNDGVLDQLDNCPDVYGPSSNNGCPEKKRRRKTQEEIEEYLGKKYRK